jgi:SAM-dependent methyltransferase
MTSVADRLATLFDHLGLERAFMATQMPGDIAGFCTAHPERIAGLALIVASRIAPAAFAPLADRVMVLAGESGIPTDTAAAAATAMPEARQIRLAGYAATAWSDIAVERPAVLCEEIACFLTSLPPPPGLRDAIVAEARVTEGSVAGITYRARGTGPALVLTPFFLATSQWEPVLDTLARRFTVIVLGGAHIGGAAMLEDRASLPSYGNMLTTLISRMKIPSAAQVLEVGCGPGPLCRQVLGARPDLALTGLDANRYLLTEGAALAKANGLAVTGPDDPGVASSAGDPSGADSTPLSGGLRLIIGDATNLPFADNSFDAVYSITVLEECDATMALAEMARVVRPGGPVGVVVRAIDMPQWWNLDLPPAIAAKVNAQPQSMSPGAVADRSLYSRMAKAGFTGVQGFPFLLTFDRPEGPIWTYRASHARGLLSDAERQIWDRECAAAEAAGLLFQANPVHCAVGRRGCDEDGDKYKNRRPGDRQDPRLKIFH